MTLEAGRSGEIGEGLLFLGGAAVWPGVSREKMALLSLDEEPLESILEPLGDPANFAAAAARVGEVGGSLARSSWGSSASKRQRAAVLVKAFFCCCSGGELD